jgi:hypothetical protein
MDAAIARYLGDLAPAAQAAATRLAETRNALAEAVARETSRLTSEKARLEALLADVPVGVLLCSGDHQLVFYNSPVVDLIGAGGVPGLDRTLFDYLREGPVRMAYARLIEAGDGDAASDILCATVAGARVLAARMRLVGGEAGAVPGYVLILRDVTADMSDLTRREALWSAKALRGPAPLPLFGADGEGGVEPVVTLPGMTLGQEMIEDYLALRLSLRGHPMELLRPRLPGLTPHDRLPTAKGRVSVAGLVITRQRPGTASGVIFLTLEDETGVSNVVVWTRVYETFRRAVIAGRLLRVTGRIERDGPITHLIAEQVEDISPLLSSLGRSHLIDPTEGRADETRRAVAPRKYHPREQAKALFPSRDFH